MKRSRKTLMVWLVFLAIVVVLLFLAWYLFNIEPAGHPDY